MFALCRMAMMLWVVQMMVMMGMMMPVNSGILFPFIPFVPYNYIH
jgi:hypothetical protein